MSAEGEGAKACPFCGCEAEIMVRPSWQREPQTYFLACRSGFGSDEPLCAGEASYPYPTKEQALKAWNSRTPDPATVRVLEAAKAVVERQKYLMDHGAWSPSDEMGALIVAVEALAGRDGKP